MSPSSLSPSDDPVDARRQALSALMDGEADAAATQRLCADWRSDEALRERWHAYQLIGDVMRSDDLAPSRAGHDAAFLQSLRERLAAEPVVMAPGRSPVAGRGAWRAPAAVAAGFLGLAAALVFTQLSMPDAEAPALTLAADPVAAPPALQRVSAAEPAAEPAQQLVVDGQLVRDARLDRYFAAHKPYRVGAAWQGGSALPVSTER